MRFRRFRDSKISPDGFDSIEFLVFNFDGQGSAIAKCDGHCTITYLLEEVEEILAGEHYIADDGKWTEYSEVLTIIFNGEEHSFKLSEIIESHGGKHIFGNTDSDDQKIVCYRFPSHDSAEAAKTELKKLKMKTLKAEIEGRPSTFEVFRAII